MDTDQKLDLLGQAASFDVCAPSGRSAAMARGCVEQPPDVRPYISHVQLPSGQKKPVLKVLLTSFCERNCHYCAFRAGRDLPRAAFTPDDLAAAFDQIQHQGLVQGLFLSSGVTGSVRTMDRMIATVEIVRQRYDYRGYVHLKILPDAEEAQIERAVRLADRVSVNLEAPNAERLATLAPRKDFGQGLMDPLRRAARAIARGQGRWTKLGLTTQFVVGAVGESDRELLTTTQRLYDDLRLARAYFSAFSPVPDTPLEEHPAAPPARQHRLYQSDFLMRHYGFRFDEFIFDTEDSLPLNMDPKIAWAQAHPERFPVEVNRAPKATLLRVPGIGPICARRILQARQQSKLFFLSDLRKLGVVTSRAAPYVLLNGKRPPLQLSLFA
jgi:predicted DNA-binding helix-hairpin-helix protein